jgi:predicted metal-binding protein
MVRGEDISGKISKILVKPHDTVTGKSVIQVYFASTTINKLSCTVAEISDNTAKVTTPLLNQILSVALAAYATGKTFSVDFYNGSCSQGGWGYISN